MALKKQATPKRWRSKEAKEIVAAVQRAGGQVERTASGHLKVIGPTGSAIVASAPNAGRAGWAGGPQHPGHDQEQDRVTDVNRSADEVPVVVVVVVVVGARRAGMGRGGAGGADHGAGVRVHP